MYTKAKIYNLALGMLLLQRQISDPATDQSNECKVLNTYYDTAFRATLEDLDLDSTSTQKALELLATDDEDFPEWVYIYKYPSNCAFFRRIKTTALMDNKTTAELKKVGMYGTVKAIFCNAENAVAEYIAHDLPLISLSATAGLATACRLATLAAPLVTGKGAKSLMDSLEKKYIVIKTEAQEQDRRENFNFPDPDVDSEWVEERLS